MSASQYSVFSDNKFYFVVAGFWRSKRCHTSVPLHELMNQRQIAGGSGRRGTIIKYFVQTDAVATGQWPLYSLEQTKCCMSNFEHDKNCVLNIQNTQWLSKNSAHDCSNAFSFRMAGSFHPAPITRGSAPQPSDHHHSLALLLPQSISFSTPLASAVCVPVDTFKIF